VSMTNTNIAIASSTPRRGVPVAGGEDTPRSIADATAHAVSLAPRESVIPVHGNAADRLRFRLELHLLRAPTPRSIAAPAARGSYEEPRHVATARKIRSIMSVPWLRPVIDTRSSIPCMFCRSVASAGYGRMPYVGIPCSRHGPASVAAS